MKKSTKAVVLTAFAVYCISLLYFFFIDARPTNFYDLSFVESLKYSINIVPFKTIGGYVGNIGGSAMNTSTIVLNLLGNLVVFLPMGFFIPAIFKKINSLAKCVLTVFALVFFIELVQIIFKIGYFDIDTFILRIAGTMIGFGIWRIKPIQKVFTVRQAC